MYHNKCVRCRVPATENRPENVKAESVHIEPKQVHHCRWGETQSRAPNQPNQIHTTPDTEPRRSRTKNPRQTSCIWFNRQLILLQSSPIKLSSQSLSPKPSDQ